MKNRNAVDYAFAGLISACIYLYFTAAICLTLQFFSIPIYYYIGVMGADIDFKTVYFGVTLTITLWGLAHRFWFRRYDKK